MDNNLAQLKVLAEVFNTDKIITSDEIEQVLKGILSIMSSFKKGNEELNAETRQVANDLLQKTLAEYDAIKESVSQETLQAGVKVATEFDQKVGEIKGLMAEVMSMKPKDGKPADETKIVQKVLSKIKLPEYKETVLDDREKIVQKINTGTKKDTKIEFAQIEGTDKFHTDLLNRAIEILDSRTKFLINKNVKHDATLSGSGTDADPLTVVGGGGGTSNHALLTNLDYASSGHTGFEPAKGADDNYVTDAEKVVIGNTSGTNTGDQTVPDNLTDFTGQTAWRVFYSDGSGDVTELALGADGTFLKSNGASSAPTFATPAGSGDVTKVGTPVNNQVGVWTGDGTLEGDAALTFDTTTDILSTGGVNLSGLTASEIVATDGSKNLQSLAVATYPSLTELTYVKGVTSAIQTQINTKSPLASPAFTGDPTAPTPSTGDNDTSIATTAFVQTAKIGYNLTAEMGGTNPSDGTTYYFGSAIGIGGRTAADTARVYIPKAGTVKFIYVMFHVDGTLGTGESSSINFRLNNTTDTLVSSAVTASAVFQVFSKTDAAIVVAAGDYFEMKWTNPTYSTNPTGCRMLVNVFIE